MRPADLALQPRARGSVLLVAALFCSPGACQSMPSTRTPSDAATAWESAVRDGNVDLAWSLLSPGLQAQLGKDAFVASFQASSPRLLEEVRTPSYGRKSQAGGSSKGVGGGASRNPMAPLRTATTVHDGGQWLTWVEVDGQYKVSSGLPGLPDLSSPERAIRAFVAAARSQDRRGMDQVLTDELIEVNAEQLEARLEAIEIALEADGLERAEDGTRASLLYGSGRRLVLQRRDGQWRVVGFK